MSVTDLTEMQRGYQDYTMNKDNQRSFFGNDKLVPIGSSERGSYI